MKKIKLLAKIGAFLSTYILLEEIYGQFNIVNWNTQAILSKWGILWILLKLFLFLIITIPLYYFGFRKDKCSGGKEKETS